MANELKRPLQALLVAPDVGNREDIETGKVTATIREGHRDYVHGLVMLCCHIVPWALQATVTGVRHSTIGELTPSECRAAGHSGRNGVLKELRRYYSNVTLKTPVTLIHWEKVNGALAKV